MGTTAQPQAAENGSTAVTKAKDEFEQEQSATQLAIGTLPDAIKNALILKRQQALVTAKLAATNWGQGLDRDTRLRIVQWAQAAGIDPATELDVLGGRFYKNSQYYIRRLSEMLAAGIVEYAYVDHIEVDPRLEQLANSTNAETAAMARQEIDRRMMMRIQYQAPEAAKSTAVFHVKLRAVAHEFTACKWCGGGTRTKDPVGDQFPVETSETRSARRCLRFIASHDPNFRPFIEQHDDDQIDQEIGGDLRDGLLKAKKEIAAAAEFTKPKPLMQLSAADPYSTSTATVQPGVEREAVAAAPETKPETKAAAAPAETKAPPAVDLEAAGAEDESVTDRSDELELLDPEERARVEERIRQGKAPF